MPRRVELDLALAGLALARNWLVGSRETVDRILEQVQRLAETPGDDVFDAPEQTVAEGYRVWAATYDDPGNPIVQLEEPAVQGILESLEPGVALDSACGTGRHAAALERLGHRVVAVDASEEMLERARSRVPSAHLRTGSLTELPVEDGAVDSVVCSLALTHLPELAPAVDELARVVRPDGRVIVSDVHPVFVALGAQAAYKVGGATAGFVRNHVHWPGAYLRAFASAGLRVEACQELPYGPREIDLWAGNLAVSRDVVVEALAGLPAVLVWDLRRLP